MGKPYIDIFGSSFTDHKMEKIQLQAFETLRNEKGKNMILLRKMMKLGRNILCWDKDFR